MLTVAVIALTLTVIFGLFFAADNIQTEIISVGDYIMTVIGKSFYLISFRSLRSLCCLSELSQSCLS
ncbi:MAG: hypothetical protein U0M95_09195 [Ruminococcus sp.]